MGEPRRAYLNFHGIGRCRRPFEVGEEHLWVDEMTFTAFVERAAALGAYEFTFDDGNRSDVEIALPILKRIGLRARFFVLTGRVGEPEFLDEGDVRTLAREGMAVGLHGRDHVSWRRADDRTLDREIPRAKADLEGIVGRTVNEAACPFGDYGRRALRSLAAAGFEAVFTSDGGATSESRWLRPRRTVRSSDDPADLRAMLCEPLRRRLVRSAKILVKKLR